MPYFTVRTDDSKYADRWFLDEPRTIAGEEIDAREFRYGRPYVGPLPASVPIQYEGRRVAFNLAAFDMPVVSEAIARAVKAIAPHDVQCFPIVVGSQIPGYEILNAIHREDCLDADRSEVMKWKPEDGRPDKVGQPRMVTNLTIDPSRCHGRDVLRIKGWEVVLVVSGRVREAMEGLQNLGILFDRVSD